MQVSGKTVLITGGGSGIGFYIGKEFIKNGAKVIACGRTMVKLEQARAENPSLEIAECDITDEGQVKALLEHCDSKFGGIDVLVNNAGIFQVFNVTDSDTSLKHQLNEVDIDFNGAVRMVHYFLPNLLQKPEAAIVNVSSGLVFVPLSMAPGYSATKAAMHAWTRALRHQLAKTNVKVFELLPPVIDTDLVSDLKDFPKMPPQKLASVFLKSFKASKLEVTSGQSNQLKMMSRLAPNFIFNMINK